MKRRAGVLAISLLAGASLVGCATSHRESNYQAVADSTITANVKAVLVQDPQTRATNISVNTLDGTVELSGFVESRAQLHQASRDAQSVNGVRSVRNELQLNDRSPVNDQSQVVGAAIDDATITHRVEVALGADSDTDSAPIKVSTSDGVVQLAGFVNSNAQRDAAGNVAGSVQGVRRIDNDLRLNPAD